MYIDFKRSVFRKCQNISTKRVFYLESLKLCTYNIGNEQAQVKLDPDTIVFEIALI